MKRLYILVTADEFELPVYIETSWQKLAKASHISRSTLSLAWARGTVIKKYYRVKVIKF